MRYHLFFPIYTYVHFDDVTFYDHEKQKWPKLTFLSRIHFVI